MNSVLSMSLFRCKPEVSSKSDVIAHNPLPSHSFVQKSRAVMSRKGGGGFSEFTGTKIRPKKQKDKNGAGEAVSALSLITRGSTLSEMSRAYNTAVDSQRSKVASEKAIRKAEALSARQKE